MNSHLEFYFAASDNGEGEIIALNPLVLEVGQPKIIGRDSEQSALKIPYVHLLNTVSRTHGILSALDKDRLFYRDISKLGTNLKRGAGNVFLNRDIIQVSNINFNWHQDFGIELFPLDVLELGGSGLRLNYLGGRK